MKLLTFSTGDGVARPGAALANRSVVDLSVAQQMFGGKFGSIQDLLTQGELALNSLSTFLRDLAANPTGNETDGLIVATDDIVLLPPTGGKPFFMSCGGLYESHRKEMNVKEPPPAQPDAFVVNPNILVGSGHPVILPPEASDQVDWEGEFCVVFGKRAHKVAPEEAFDYIAGYTIHNDVSARNNVPMLLSDDPGQALNGFKWNVLYKQFPTFAPLGPFIVTKDELPEPGKARLTTSVNGKIMQDDLVGNLATDMAQVISAITEIHTFDAGDILSLGTPSGVGYARDPKVFLTSGDTVEVTVEGIGTLRNTIC